MNNYIFDNIYSSDSYSYYREQIKEFATNKPDNVNDEEYSEYCHNAMDCAVKYDSDLEIFKMLLENPYIHIDWDNYEHLYQVYLFGNIKMLKLLLEQPFVNINQTCKYRTTILFNQDKYFDDDIKGKKQLVLEHPSINVNFQIDDDGTSPLLYACKYNNVEEVKLLLEHSKIDVNLQDYNGNTPLHLASEMKYVEIVKLLLEHPNININLKNKDGETALHIVCARRYFCHMKLLLSYPTIDKSIKNNKGETAFDIINKQYLNFKEAHDLLL